MAFKWIMLALLSNLLPLSSSSSENNPSLLSARTVVVLSYFFTVIFFFCSTFYASLPAEKMWILFIFFMVCTIPLLQLPPLNLEERLNNIFLYAISKSIGSFACNYIFNWIGSSLKIETDTFLMNASLSFVFFLIAIDHLYDIDEDVGLCDGYLFAGFGLVTAQKVIPQWVVLCIGPSVSLLKNYLQLSRKVGSQWGRGDIKSKGLMIDGVAKYSRDENVVQQTSINQTGVEDSLMSKLKIQLAGIRKHGEDLNF